MRFDWDNAKAERNRQNHGVTFAEAATVWGDPLHYTVPDPDHPREEERLLTIGNFDRGRRI